MIEKTSDRYDLQCDFCSNRIEEFDTFMDAVEYKKQNRWRSIKSGDDWSDSCPNCNRSGVNI